MSAQRLGSQVELRRMAANDHPGFQDVAAQAPQHEVLVELVGGIAHDMNNLLTVIMGAAEALSEDLDAGSDQQDLALVTLRAAERGAALLRRLVAWQAVRRAVGDRGSWERPHLSDCGAQ